MFMLSQHRHLFKVVIKIPYLNLGLIRTRYNVRFGRVHNNGSDKISMCLELLDFLHSIIIEDPNMEIIRPANNPLLLEDKPYSPHRVDGCLNSSDTSLYIKKGIHLCYSRREKGSPNRDRTQPSCSHYGSRGLSLGGIAPGIFSGFTASSSFYLCFLSRL